jgi:hypothetical protein
MMEPEASRKGLALTLHLPDTGAVPPQQSRPAINALLTTTQETLLEKMPWRDANNHARVDEIDADSWAAARCGFPSSALRVRVMTVKNRSRSRTISSAQ